MIYVPVRGGDMSAQQVGALEGDAAVLAEQLGPAHRVVHEPLVRRGRVRRRQPELEVVVVFFLLFLLLLCGRSEWLVNTVAI